MRTMRKKIMTPSFPIGIIWNAAQNISGDTDVSTQGTLLFAQGASCTINSVTFGASTSVVAVPSFGGQFGGFGSGNPPFSSLSSSYQTLLSNGSYNDSTFIQQYVTIKNLNVGKYYLVQWWLNDARPINRPQTLTSIGGNSIVMQDSVGNFSGSPGQYAIGYFWANSTSQTIILPWNAGHNLQLNALQVRRLT